MTPMDAKILGLCSTAIIVAAAGANPRVVVACGGGAERGRRVRKLPTLLQGARE